MSVSETDIPIVGPSNNLPQDDPELTVNLYAEKISDDALTLKATPGTVYNSKFGINGGGRGVIEVGGRIFGVRGAFFQEMINGVPSVIGTLTTLQNPVAMISNVRPNGIHAGTFQILIVDDTNGYVYQSSDSSWHQLTGLGGDNFLGGLSQAAFCAGRAYVFAPGTSQIQASNQYDFLTWDTTATVTCLSLPDPLVALTSNGNLLYAMSSGGFEVWQDDGSVPFGLARILSGDKIGCMAPDSLLFSQRFCIWLGGNTEGRGVVYKHEGGGRPTRISDNAIEREIASLSNPDDAVAFAYESLGHVFYVITFRSGNKTLVYDSSTGLWHERNQRDPNTGSIYALPFVNIAIQDGTILGIDYRDGTLWEIDDNVFTDNGNQIVRDRILAPVPAEADWMTFYQSVELFGQIGNTPVGQDPPQIALRYSLDRGLTWSEEWWQQAGGNNTYAARTRWVGLGSGFSLTLWFRIVCNQYISFRSVRLRAE